MSGKIRSFRKQKSEIGFLVKQSQTDNWKMDVNHVTWLKNIKKLQIIWNAKETCIELRFIKWEALNLFDKTVLTHFVSKAPNCEI